MAEDQFERYYTEKLWEGIPAIYRYEDGIADQPGTLRALVQVIARQAAVLRRSQDHLWDDQFIELCNEWAVPYIGQLVATRLLSAMNKRGRRIDVAKTIYYRRRKGTPRILEELINDISGWEGKLVEQFTKLGRARHGLDPHPLPLAGRYSGTMPGGWADLRNPRIGELTNGPFEEYFHTPDMRRYNGSVGRYSIPKLAFYLYRLRAFAAIGVTPFAKGDGMSYTFDPSGRDIPLFSKRLRSDDWDEWHSALEWELPAPIPCRLLGHAEYVIDDTVILQLVAGGLSVAAEQELGKIEGLRFKNESSLVTVLDSFSNKAELLDPAHFIPLLAAALVPDCGKQALLPDADTLLSDPLETSSIVVGFDTPVNSIISVEHIVAANLQSWTADTDKDLAIDAERGRFKFTIAPNPAKVIYTAYHYGFSGPVGAGPYDRMETGVKPADVTRTGGGALVAADLPDQGITQLDDSKTYGPLPDLVSIKDLEFRAANSQRPYCRLDGDWVLDSGANTDSSLTLDGLWIGSAGDVKAAIVIQGNFDCVVIRNCTIDPGGSNNATGEILHPLSLIIKGRVANLCIEASILGPVVLDAAGDLPELSITDSIVQSVDAGVAALQIGMGLTNLQSSTVFGNAQVHRLEASEALITGLVITTDTQNGCFRFSAAPAASRLPRPYESFLFDKDANHWFTSRLFGNPGYGQLSETAEAKIVRGAENGSEMGAFSSLLNPVKLDGLKSKVDEYMPFGLIPVFINKT
ncbi:MAG TPA: hypothetical protein VK563_10635 [Puia sp.]|nr:hypothetical protein [Puia sp.]